MTFFMVNNPQRFKGARVKSAFTLAMLVEPSLQISGYTGIKSLIFTLKNIYIPNRLAL